MTPPVPDRRKAPSKPSARREHQIEKRCAVDTGDRYCQCSVAGDSNETEVEGLFRLRPRRRGIDRSEQALCPQRRVEIGFAENSRAERTDHHLVHLKIEMIDEGRIPEHFGEMHIGGNPHHILDTFCCMSLRMSDSSSSNPLFVS